MLRQSGIDTGRWLALGLMQGRGLSSYQTVKHRYGVSKMSKSMRWLHDFMPTKNIALWHVVGVVGAGLDSVGDVLVPPLGI